MAAGGRIAVVGAGWAGLACAAELAAAGRPVVVLEASRQPGGRARSVELDGRRLDNGQHLLVGAYTETLRLMRLVGADPACLLARLPLCIDYPGRFRLQLPDWPAPLHLAAGLLRAEGVGLREKLAAAAFMQELKRRRFRLESDATVAAWLDAHGQRGALRRFLWEPLCLAALNTPPAQASAQIFANVLRDSLGGPSGATDLLLQRADLGRVFPEQAARRIAELGGEVRTSHRVRDLQPQDDGWRVDGECFDHVVLAVAPQHLAPLLAARPAHAALLRQVDGYAYEPIGTLYLSYPAEVRLPFPMLGLAGPVGQWVFDRGAQGGPAGLLACVFSGGGEWEGLDDDALAAALHAEIAAALADPLPPPHWRRSVRERRATFSCRPDLPRPTAATAERGLWLAGDHTCADYPATIEGAVRSGVAAARAILSQR
ncbi:MAG: FAD-dependent oxidoreductase [Rhodocyclaceae bacterium]|nr:FAD-dependent oxidoreductase [Rhodocyclaceae bacterium]